LNGRYDIVDIVTPLKFLTILRESPLIFLGGLMYAVSFVIWIAALSKLELSFMYPIATGAVFVLITLLSFVFLKENITPYRILGIALIAIESVFLLKSA